VTKQLDLTDIQGNLLRSYGRASFPIARYVFVNFRDGARAREFIGKVASRVTTAVSWGEGPDPVQKPMHTLNVAFTYAGLKALELPRASLIGFPMEFVMGMRPRADILGDDRRSAPEFWDPIWRNSRHRDRDKDVHAWLAINAQNAGALHDGYTQLLQLVYDSGGGVQVLTGHRGSGDRENLAYQEVHVLFEDGKLSRKEHFGYTDGIGDPVFEGMPCKPERVVGRGKQMKDGSWAPLATGEFILGHRDEAQEYPVAPSPQLLARNGTFMVYRKLHENVGSFNRLLDEEGAKYPGGKELLAAKFVGRWRDNGAPIVSAPDADSKAAWDDRFSRASPLDRDRMLSGFTFDDDMHGAKCPFSSHLRRINPRASLEFTKGAFDTPGALSNRRRVLRRGLPYGEVSDPSRDDGEHGIIIMMLNASISRQFEFVQQQWVNYGNDFHAANDKEIILGNHGDDDAPSRAVIQVDPDSDEAPYILRKIPRLVETRGGDYFFVPSLTALRMIAQGIVDPT